MTDNITGKVVVITGASSGLGEAAARLLGNKCAKAVLGARWRDRLDALAAELTASGTDVEVCTVDVANAVDINALLFRPTVQEY